MILLCFLLTYFLFHSIFENYGPNVLTAAAYFGLFVLATVCICLKQKRFSLKALLPGLLCIAASLCFVLHSDEDLHLGIFLLLIPMSGFYCMALTNANVHSFGSFYVLLDLIRCELLLPLRHLFAPLSCGVDTIKKRRAAHRADRRHKTWLPVLIGMLTAIPVLLIVIPLLIDADAAFESFAGTAFASVRKALDACGDWIADYIPFNGFALFLALLFTPYIAAVIFNFANGTAKNENIDTSAKYQKLQRVPVSFFAALLSVISAVYVLYLFSQTAYFFSAFSGQLPYGAEITVTEYARRGFFEMVKLAGVNAMLIGLSVGLCKRKDGQLPKALKGLNAFLCVFAMLLCVISISKILLYIRSFGLTEKRLYVLAADVVLIFVFLAILLRLFLEKFPYMKVILGAGCACAVLLGLLGVNRTIAWYNTSRLFSNTEANCRFEDVWVDCGDAALPYLQRIASSDLPFAKDAQNKLDEIYLCESWRRDEPFYNLEQARFVRAVQINGIDAESLMLQVNFDCPETVYALEYGFYSDGKIVLSGGMTHADNSPLNGTETIEIRQADLPENTDLSDLEIRFSLCFSPEEDAESFAVKTDSEDLLKGVGFGEQCRILITRTENGELIAL